MYLCCHWVKWQHEPISQLDLVFLCLTAGICIQCENKYAKQKYDWNNHDWFSDVRILCCHSQSTQYSPPLETLKWNSTTVEIIWIMLLCDGLLIIFGEEREFMPKTNSGNNGRNQTIPKIKILTMGTFSCILISGGWLSCVNVPIVGNQSFNIFSYE